MTVKINLTIIFALFGGLCAFEFDRNTSGVVYLPYCKLMEKLDYPARESYTLNEVKVMLSVISTKFSRFTTFGIGANRAELIPYEKNVTYFKSRAKAWVAEATALLNAERKAKVLTALLGVWVDSKEALEKVEVEVAFESIQRAELIFPGSVEGIVLTGKNIHSQPWALRTCLDVIRDIREKANEMGFKLKLGTRQNCDGMNGTGELAELRREVVLMSDFIICAAEPATEVLSEGPEAAFGSIQPRFLNAREAIKRINPKIEVQGQTSWYSSSINNEPWATPENLVEYWKAVARFAVENNYFMWHYMAFDNPLEPWPPHYGRFGWWQLKNNSMAGVEEGYQEKISLFEETNDDEEEGGGINWIFITSGIVGALIILGLVGIIFYSRLKIRKLELNILSEREIAEFFQGVSEEMAKRKVSDGFGKAEQALIIPYDKALEIDKRKLRTVDDGIIGHGNFGCVYHAVLGREDGETHVALKIANGNCTKLAMMGILTEIKILSYLGKHENIVGIEGAYTAEISKGVLFLATEFCEMGSLQKYLRSGVFVKDESDVSGGGNEIYIPDMIRWSKEIAIGMEYLSLKQVIHADLAARNVLLDADRRAKITDFGLSRRLFDYTVYLKTGDEPLPWKWTALEALKSKSFSTKSDVWSFGVTLWEIFSMGNCPFPGLEWSPEFVNCLEDGLRMQCPSNASLEIYEVMMHCWQLKPSDRPTFAELNDSLGELLYKFEGYSSRC